MSSYGLVGFQLYLMIGVEVVWSEKEKYLFIVASSTVDFTCINHVIKLEFCKIPNGESLNGMDNQGKEEF